APDPAERSLNRSDWTGLRLPRCPVGVLALWLEQLLVGHAAAQRALARRPIARHDAMRDNGSRTRQPRPGPGRDFGRRPRLLLEHRLAQIAFGNADVLAERQDFVGREPFADLALSRLQLGGAFDDALERVTADEILPHQTLALPLFRTAGRRSPAPAARSGRAAEGGGGGLPVGATRSMKTLNRSMGMGKIVVELFSEAISLT